MTKVLLEYDLLRGLDDLLLDRIAAAHSVLGLHRLTVAPGGDRLTVEYDAARLTPDQVSRALRSAGIPAALRADS